MEIKTITNLQNLPKDKYGDFKIDIDEGLKIIYPEIKVIHSDPGCWGGSPEITLSGKILTVSSGEYKSNKHFHTAGAKIRAIESARNCRLNLPKKPLILLKSYIYNGDYRSLSFNYSLFGKNEDDSYFCHKIRPKIGELGDLKACRDWMWEVKKNEKIAARQGDIAFIPKKSGRGSIVEGNNFLMGNHEFLADLIKETKHKIYLLNPKAIHYEHDPIELKGWFEIRLAKVWQMGYGND